MTAFCCKSVANFTRWGDPDCGRHDLVFVGGKHRRAEQWHLELVLGVVSNAAFVIPLVMLHRRGRVFDVIIGTALTVTSLLYHACETLDTRFLKMNAGNFHRLDNVFSILCFATLVPLSMEASKASRSHVDAFRSSMLVVTLLFQELNPWHVACSVAPLVFAALFFSAWAKRRASMRQVRRRRELALPLCVQLFSIACFVKGLDQKRDPARCWHFAWHLLNAVAASLFTAALAPLQTNRKLH